jgi:hypothetical protein
MQNVSWQDYAGLDGFGGGAFGPAELEAINKALTVGQDINNPGAAPGQGFPLRVESLEATLKNLTFQMSHIRLWKAIPKIPAANTVEEFNEISSYGVSDQGFVAEGALPNEDDSTYARRYAVIKYLGTTRKVSHVATMVRSATGNIIANETVNGTMLLLRMVESALFYGDSALSDLQFDGFSKMIASRSPASNVVDLRGQPLDEDVLQDISLILSDAPNYGVPTHMHMNPRVKADLVKSIFPKGRYDVFNKPDSGMIGLDSKGYVSPAGDVVFEPNTFITDGGSPTAAAVGDASKIPGSPTISTAATSPVDALSKFGADDAGSYWYYIVAHNDYGHSAPVAVSGAAIAIAAGDKMTFGVTPAAAGVKWFQLYRTKMGVAAPALSDYRLIAKIPNAAGAGATTVNDYNGVLPFCTEAFLFQQNVQALSFKQLCPMIKIPLATTDANIRWMQFLYGTPTLYAPGKVLKVINIGRAAGSISY